MHYPTVLIVESKSRLHNLLQSRVPQPRWLLRTARNIAECRQVLSVSSTAIVVIGVGAQSQQAFDVLAWLAEHRPLVSAILAAEIPLEEVLQAGWIAGVRYVLEPDAIDDHLAEIVERLIAGRWPLKVGATL